MNLHSLRNQILSLARLPIPPLAQTEAPLKMTADPARFKPRLDRVSSVLSDAANEDQGYGRPFTACRIFFQDCQVWRKLSVYEKPHGSRTNDNGMVEITCDVSDARPDILHLQIRNIRQDFFLGCTAGAHVEHILDTDAHATDAQSATALIWIDRNSLEVVAASASFSMLIGIPTE